MLKECTYLFNFNNKKDKLFVSEDGEIFKYNHTHDITRKLIPFLKHPKTSKHMLIRIYLKPNTCEIIRVDELICTVYNKSKPFNSHVIHLDGNVFNNKPENLIWSHDYLISKGFKPVVNYRDIVDYMYYVNEFGDVYSYNIEQTLIHNRNCYNYHVITMVTKSGGQRTITIHNLVMIAYKNEFPPKEMKQPSIDHIDHDINNNHISNLRWLELEENSKDGRDHIPFNFGESNPVSKFLDNMVYDIYTLYDHGFTTSEILNLFKKNMILVDKTTLQKYHNGKLRDYQFQQHEWCKNNDFTDFHKEDEINMFNNPDIMQNKYLGFENFTDFV